MRPAYYMGQLVYFELNIDAIIQKYCVNKDKPEFQCNGKCHLATQLSATSTSNDDDTKSLSVISESFLPVFISKQQEFNFTNPKDYTHKKQIFSYVNTYLFLHTLVTYKPPIT